MAKNNNNCKDTFFQINGNYLAWFYFGSTQFFIENLIEQLRQLRNIRKRFIDSSYVVIVVYTLFNRKFTCLSFLVSHFTKKKYMNRESFGFKFENIWIFCIGFALSL